MLRTALLIALHAPPHSSSSGVQRTLHLARELVKQGWRPIIITVPPFTLQEKVDRSVELVDEFDTERVFAFNAAKHFAIFRRYPSCLAIPDRYWTWPLFFRIRMARLMDRYRPELIWSTQPVPSAHVIAAFVKRQTGLAWVADFRDPLVYDEGPADGMLERRRSALEREVALNADYITFASPSARKKFLARHPEAEARSSVILNGYDPSIFSQGSKRHDRFREGRARFRFVHSGHIYADIRNPSGLLKALQLIKRDQPDIYRSIEVVFRGGGSDELLRALIARHEVGSTVQVLSGLPREAAVQEMEEADCLIVLQRSGANAQIPAKIYEYACSGRPILGLVDPAGDSAAALQDMGYSAICSPDDPAAIRDLIVRFVSDVQKSSPIWRVADDRILARFTRQAGSLQFCELFERVSRSPLIFRPRLPAKDYIGSVFRSATRIASPRGRRAKLSVLTFHRVLEEKDALFPSEPDVEEFETRLRWLSSQFNLLPLGEACAQLYAGTLQERAAAISFDDGYSATLEIVLPILRSLKVPATCFVATGFSRSLMFNDRVIEAFRHTRTQYLDASSLKLGRLDLSDPRARRQSLIDVIQRLKYSPPEERDAIVDELEKALGYREKKPMMLTEDRIRQIHRAGIEIGSHTRNHYILSTLPDEYARREIIAGRDDIERITGVRPTLFAYPNGHFGADFDAGHSQMIRDAGFRFAFTTDTGCAGMGTDPFLIPRFTPWDTTRLRYRARLLLNSLGLQRQADMGDAVVRP
ncbi:MAG: polysaccharide deacetylase family protein [Burkholderiaceae bacterium]